MVMTDKVIKKVATRPNISTRSSVVAIVEALW